MTTRQRNNLDWLIAARGYAMFGVFLGHLMTSYINDGEFTSLIFAGQFLEPMFVPFFAMLTGAFYSRGNSGFVEYGKLKFGQRILPVWFYLLLIIPFYLALPPPNKTSGEALSLAPLYLLGIPYLSWPSWFLVALFTSEILYFFIQPLARNRRLTVLLALLCYSAGWWFNRLAFGLPDVIRGFTMLWMFNASFLFCAFFLTGMLIRPYLLALGQWPSHKVILSLLAAVAVFIPATLLNQAHFITGLPESFFRFVRNDMMAISFGQYGHYLWGLLSMLAAAATLACISRLIPVTRFMRACGDYSLVLLGLNGILLNVLNSRITGFFVPPADQLIYTFSYVFVLSLLSMALCLPVAMGLEKLFPQLTGKPMLKGPVLPALYRKKSRPL